jgi:hypothetical protein
VRPEAGARCGARPGAAALSAMRWLPPCAAAAALFFAGIAAHASEATLLADRAGFLIGHAQRCGVADARLERSATFVEKLIAAYAVDRDDRVAAKDRFAKRLLASALAELLGDPTPSCAVVRSQLALFERHRLVASAGRRNAGGAMAHATRSQPPAQGRKAAASAARPAQRAPTASAAPAADRRTAVALKRTARQLRRQSPSI